MSGLSERDKSRLMVALDKFHRNESTYGEVWGVVAAIRDEAKAEALREAADDLRTNAAIAWGEDRAWFTTGGKVAHLAAEWIGGDQ